MKPRHAAVGIALLWAAAATPPAHAATLEQCQAVLKLNDMISADQTEVWGGDGCRYRGFHVAPTSMIDWRFDTLSIRRVDFAQLAQGQTPPSMELYADGVVFSPLASSFMSTTIMRAIAKPFDVVLDYDFAKESGVLTLHRFTLKGPAIGNLTLSGRFSGMKWVPLPDIENIGAGAGVDELNLRLENIGLFETYVAPPLISLLLAASDDPNQTVEQWKTAAIQSAQTDLGAAGTAPNAIHAITGFIGDLPRPRGVFVLKAAFPAPLTLAQALGPAANSRTPADRAALAAISASYEPHPEH